MNQNKIRLKTVITLLMANLLLGSAITQASEAGYTECAACHGAKGEGRSTLKSPAIAGQHAWYLEKQLNDFAEGKRGKHPQDTSGQAMQLIAKQLIQKNQLSDLVAYINSLPPPINTLSQTGDLKNGSRYYQARCGACHGGKAQGNSAFKAPKLSGLSPAYILKQMKNFQEGIRGYVKNDKLGKQMALMSKTVSKHELDDIVLFISQQY